jgi:hypothetical protein
MAYRSSDSHGQPILWVDGRWFGRRVRGRPRRLAGDPVSNGRESGGKERRAGDRARGAAEAEGSRSRTPAHPSASLQQAHREGVRPLDQAVHLLSRQAPSGRDGSGRVTAFLTALAVRDRVAASTQDQALNALLFLYRDVLELELPWLDNVVRAKRPEHLPVVLTRAETQAVIDTLGGAPRLMALLMSPTEQAGSNCRGRLGASTRTLAANGAGNGSSRQPGTTSIGRPANGAATTSTSQWCNGRSGRLSSRRAS